MRNQYFITAAASYSTFHTAVKRSSQKSATRLINKTNNNITACAVLLPIYPERKINRFSCEDNMASTGCRIMQKSVKTWLFLTY